MVNMGVQVGAVDRVRGSADRTLQGSRTVGDGGWRAFSSSRLSVDSSSARHVAQRLLVQLLQRLVDLGQHLQRSRRDGDVDHAAVLVAPFPLDEARRFPADRSAP